MVKKRTQKCERCGREVLIRSKGLCPACRVKDKKQVSFHSSKPSSFRRAKDPGLSGFFNLMLEELKERMMSETGRSIPFPTVANVCHILPKRTYKSIAEERDNILFLTLEEHNKFDALLDKLEFERLENELGYVWRIAVKRILEMEKKGLIKERGRIIIEVLNKYGTDKENLASH